MSIINRFLTAVTEPEFKLARDLTAMATADGEVTPEEKEAISTICQIEGIDEAKLLETLKGNNEPMEKGGSGDRSDPLYSSQSPSMMFAMMRSTTLSKKGWRRKQL